MLTVLGAIQLVLSVAAGSDKGNRALSWIMEGRPEGVGSPSRTLKSRVLTLAVSRILELPSTKHGSNAMN
jgi:hypothetical protein